MKCIGAIIGDVVGSAYEFDNVKNKDFPLFTKRTKFTDDSIMTIATMQALMNGGTAQDFITAYQTLGNKYPSSYGNRFQNWLLAKDPEPYNSWGNGSAMRVSPVAWFYDNLEDVERAAEVSASVTHNHPEGIKGAQATAATVFLARTGKTKQEIKDYIAGKYAYYLDFTLDDIRPTYDFDESCQGTVPPGLVAYFECADFEDAIRGAISIGGDSDTLAAITGAIAEASYGVPEQLADKALAYLPDELKDVVAAFNQSMYPSQMLPESPWSNLPEAAPYILPEDREAIEHHKNYLSLHLETYPEPLVGGLDNAKVVFLALNPGFTDDDVDVNLQLPEFIAGCRSNIADPFTSPFYYFEGGLEATGGYRWWAARLKPLVRAGIPLEVLKDKIMMVEYFPYHSVNYHHINVFTPSQRYSFEIVREAIRRGKTIIIMRSRALWIEAVPELVDYPYLELNSPQNVSISRPNLDNKNGIGTFDRLVAMLKEAKAE